MEPYVIEVEERREDWVIFHCACDDTYQAFLEDGAWWLLVYPGDPSEGPFEAVDDMVNWLNDEEN